MLSIARCIACGRKIWKWQKIGSNQVMHEGCEKIWNLGYECRRKLDHMLAEKHGIKTVSDLFAEERQKKNKNVK
jgi:hypothetical protein